MQRFRGTKRVWAIVLAVILVMTFAFTGEVNAATENARYISKNDLAKFSNEVAHYKITWDKYDICPTNSAYYITYLSGVNGEITGEERNRVIENAYNNGFDETLTGTFGVKESGYLSRDLIVVSKDTTLYLPAYLDDIGTYIEITGGNARDIGVDTPVDEYDFGNDLIFRCSDFMNDECVYYDIETGGCDIGTTVHHFIVSEDKLDAFLALRSLYDEYNNCHFTITPKIVDIGASGTMYRVYNENSGEHFYTADAAEAQSLTDIDWTYEGHSWQAPASSKTPVYRIYNTNSGEHHYTASTGERDSLISLGWNDEGIGFYSDDAKGTPMYRLYNPNATGRYEAGAHHYTADTAERDSLVAIGWRDEGVAWYGV